jgi:hypothetical protein
MASTAFPPEHFSDEPFQYVNKVLAVKSVSTGKFLRVHPSGRIDLTPQVSAWTQLLLYQQPDRSFSFYSPVHSLYIEALKRHSAPDEGEDSCSMWVRATPNKHTTDVNFWIWAKDTWGWVIQFAQSPLHQGFLQAGTCDSDSENKEKQLGRKVTARKKHPLVSSKCQDMEVDVEPRQISVGTFKQTNFTRNNNGSRVSGDSKTELYIGQDIQEWEFIETDKLVFDNRMAAAYQTLPDLKTSLELIIEMGNTVRRFKKHSS